MENNIVIRKEDILTLKEEGGKLILSPKGEEAFVKLLELKKFIDETIEEVKDKIVETGLDIDEDFKGLVGERVRATYRYTDSVYTYKKAEIDISEPFLKKVEYYKVDTEKVEQYENEVGELPQGIYYKDRTKKLVIKLNEEN